MDVGVLWASLMARAQQIEAEVFHDAGDKVVAVMRQRGRSKATGAPVDMHFAQVWTLDAGERTRMEIR